MRLFPIPAVFCIALSAFAADRAFLSFTDAKPVLDAQAAHLPAELKNPTEARWNAWTRQQDKAIRARLEQGDLDSMVNLLLFGTSFTHQPRIRMESLTEASRSGVLKARVDDLVAGLRQPSGNERLEFLSGLLRARGLDPESTEGARQTGMFILSNLERVVEEARTFAQRAAAADRKSEAPQKAGAANNPAALIDRASLFADRGVSLDTSIFPDFAIEQTLRDLVNRGLLREGQAARAAVIGPGLDFIDKNEAAGYDYYPQQTLQPFAFYDSLLRLKLAKSGAVSMSIFDISSRVIDHIQHARERARKGAGYVIQLPRDIARPWPDDVVAYWKSLGDRAGSAVAPVQPPDIFKSLNGGHGLETRAVEIRPSIVLAVEPQDLNIVLERANLAPADRFDVIIATNIFVYYDPFEQALALENVGAMLKPGGLLLTNDLLPELPGGSMKLAGVTDVPLATQGSVSHQAVGWYRRR
jgi:SAM-dependent methyltransferase